MLCCLYAAPLSQAALAAGPVFLRRHAVFFFPGRRGGRPFPSCWRASEHWRALLDPGSCEPRRLISRTPAVHALRVCRGSALPTRYEPRGGLESAARQPAAWTALDQNGACELGARQSQHHDDARCVRSLHGVNPKRAGQLRRLQQLQPAPATVQRVVDFSDRLRSRPLHTSRRTPPPNGASLIHVTRKVTPSQSRYTHHSQRHLSGFANHPPDDGDPLRVWRVKAELVVALGQKNLQATVCSREDSVVA